MPSKPLAPGTMRAVLATRCAVCLVAFAAASAALVQPRPATAAQASAEAARPSRALEALLSMPAFLLRAEADPADAAVGTVYPVSDLELASRLAFFVWKSIPDEELLDVATRGRLREPAVLARQGLLGHGSVLTVTSYANRTSVALRGKWVLETLLGAPPPPPPPNVPPLEENDAAGEPTSLREKMEQHRANPVCASCHADLDPLGFTLENFDAIGRWRDDDDGAPIDAAITWNGADIDGPASFRDVLLEQSEYEFVRTVAEKLLTYALGRGLDFLDAPTVRQIVRQAAPDGYRWSSLVLGIVESAPFQQRIVLDGTHTQKEQ